MRDHSERTADTVWAVVPLLDETKPTQWFVSDMHPDAQSLLREGYTIQYRPRKRRVKQKTVPLTER